MSYLYMQVFFSFLPLPLPSLRFSLSLTHTHTTCTVICYHILDLVLEGIPVNIGCIHIPGAMLTRSFTWITSITPEAGIAAVLAQMKKLKPRGLQWWAPIHTAASGWSGIKHNVFQTLVCMTNQIFLLLSWISLKFWVA